MQIVPLRFQLGDQEFDCSLCVLSRELSKAPMGPDHLPGLGTLHVHDFVHQAPRNHHKGEY